MFWLAGLEKNAHGTLLTFEPNPVWQPIADANLRQIGSRYLSFLGTFEEKIAFVPLPENGIDIAFVDAIHTSAFVESQVDILLNKMREGAILFLDDINFSDDMQQCWKRLSADPRFKSSLRISDRVGVLEFRG